MTGKQITSGLPAMPLRAAALGFALILALPAAADTRELKKGMKFRAAQRLLLSQGWQRVNVHGDDAYECLGIESALVKAGIRELESCALDRPLCIFNYRKGKRCLRLMTQGESLKDLRVERWSDACPESH